MPSAALPKRPAALALAFVVGCAGPALPDTANLAPAEAAHSGPVTRVVLAQRNYEAAIEHGDALLLVGAIRLARSVTLRPAIGWTRTISGPAPGEQPAGRTAAPDPASPEALRIAQALAGEDPTLQDLVYDIDAQLPIDRHATVTEAQSELAGGQSDIWRIALPGDVPAELGLIGDGDTALSLTVADEAGNSVCAVPAQADPALCRFTPPRNEFYSVTVTNSGQIRNSYRLIGN
ncbi:MAG: hypothetical protein ACK40I_09110 [Tabrizicola sp.]